MEKKFEEKFGLKAEEMEEILGGIVAALEVEASAEGGCFMCTTSCVSCTTTCTACQKIVFV